MRLKIFHLAVPVLIIGLWACDVEDCISTKSSVLWVQFYNAETDTVYVAKSIETFSEGGNPLIVEDSSFNTFPFFLNPSSDSTNYYFNIDVEVPSGDSTILEARDSLFFHVKYTRRQRIISVNCGVEQSFYNIEFTAYNFDKIEMVTDTIDRFNPVNVKVFF